MKLIRAFFEARFGVTSFKSEVKGSRVLMNVLAILFAFAGLIAIGSLEPEFSFFDALPAGILLVISAALFMFSD